MLGRLGLKETRGGGGFRMRSYVRTMSQPGREGGIQDCCCGVEGELYNAAWSSLYSCKNLRKSGGGSSVRNSYSGQGAIKGLLGSDDYPREMGADHLM